MTTRTTSFYDKDVAAAADGLVREVVSTFVGRSTNVAGGRFAGVVRAPAGAGKSHLVTTVAGAARESARGRGGAIVIATPTNDQAYGLVASIAERYPKYPVAFVAARNRVLPATTATQPNVHTIHARDAGDYPVVVGTLDKLGDAASRGDLPRFQYLCIDEAFQSDAAKYYKVGDIADRHLLVGDPGQLDPFTTMDDPDRWRGLPEDPTQTAVEVLTRNHAGVEQHLMPITRRLPPAAVPVVRAFYPGHEFHAWTLPGARRMRLVTGVGRGRLARLDRALDIAATDGWAWIRLPNTPVLTADPATIETIVGLVHRLSERAPEVASERTEARWTTRKPSRVAVAVSHNDQKDHLRAALDGAGLAAIRVDTANKLQGLEFDFLVAWHPLAGLPEADGFHLEPGRLCVMLTRHRHTCIVVGRASDPELVDDLPPTSDVWLGHDPDPVLDGWFAHSLVYKSLEPFAVDF